METRTEASANRVLAQQETEQKRIADEAKARQKDKDHRADINYAALTAIVSIGLNKGDAKKVVTAIAEGLIPNVKVVY